MKLGVMSLAVLMLPVFALVSCKGKKSGSSSSSVPFSGATLVASEGGVSYLDENYRFSIRGLGPKWRLLEEKERARIIPDAAAMAAMIGGGYGAVLVEPYGDTDLKAYSDLIVTNLKAMASEHTAGETREVDFGGGKALRRRFHLTMHEIAFDYELMVFLHQGMAYQVLAWRPVEGANPRAPEEFLGAVGIEEGVVRIPPPAPAPDQMGLGSRIIKGRFESAISRAVVTPSGPWGLVWGQSLASIASDAETAIQRTDQGIYITLASQPVAAARRQHFIDSLAASIPEGIEVLGTKNWTVGGEPVACTEMMIAGPPATRIFRGHFVRGDRGYRINVWHLERAGVDRTESIAEGLATFSFLDEASAAALRSALESGAEAPGSAGGNFSLRAGVYRDFERGLVWKQPAGFWRVETGDQAAASNRATSMLATELESGMMIQLVSQSARNFTPQSFHDGVLEDLEERGFRKLEKELPPMEVDGHEVLRSHLVFQNEAEILEFHSATVIVEEQAYQLNCGATPDIMAERSGLAEQALAGFSFPGKKLQPVETSRGSHRDLRMGFEFHPPVGMRLTPQFSNQVISKVGSVAAYTGARGMVMHMAIQTEGGANDTDVAMGMINSVFKLNLDRSSDAGSAERSETIGGAPASVRSGTSKGDHLRVAIFRQGGVLHLGLIMGKTQKDVDSLLAEYKAGFSFIP